MLITSGLACWYFLPAVRTLRLDWSSQTRCESPRYSWKFLLLSDRPTALSLWIMVKNYQSYFCRRVTGCRKRRRTLNFMISVIVIINYKLHYGLPIHCGNTGKPEWRRRIVVFSRSSSDILMVTNTLVVYSVVHSVTRQGKFWFADQCSLLIYKTACDCQ